MNGIWIRSQDKTELIFCIGIDCAQYTVFGVSGEYQSRMLGVYKSTERCKKVINDIESHINLNRKSVFDMPEE
jgi:hypothetical protein